MIAKRALLVVPAVALLALSACGEQSEFGPAPTTETVTSEVTTSVTPAPSLEAEDRVVPPEPEAEPAVIEPVESEDDFDLTDMVMQSVMANEGVYLEDGFGGEYARLTCEALDDGLTPMDAMFISMDSLPGYTMDEHAMLVGASIGAECPQHSDRIPG